MMNFKEIQELIKLINRSNISEFKLKEGEFQLTIRGNQQVIADHSAAAQQPVYMAQPNYAPLPAAAAPVAAPAEIAAPAASPASAPTTASQGLVEIKSPIVGTFYRSSSPDKPVYIKVGDIVEKGQIVCIVEAMKLFNEIESEVRGKVVKVVTDDLSPVEYDQVLFLVDPKG